LRAPSDAESVGPNRHVVLEPAHSRAVVYFRTVVAGERGRCDVRGSSFQKLLIWKAFRPGALRSRKFSSKLRRPPADAARKLWAKSRAMSGGTVQLIRTSPNATHAGKIPATFFSYERARLLHCAASRMRCCESTAASNARFSCPRLHAKVTNAVLNLANTGSPFVTSESRLVAAFCDSGGVEASLAVKALQSRLGAISLPASAQPRSTHPVAHAFEASALRSGRDTAGHQKKPFNLRWGPIRCGEAVGRDGRRRV
jgi:hypothetical protein